MVRKKRTPSLHGKDSIRYVDVGAIVTKVAVVLIMTKMVFFP